MRPVYISQRDVNPTAWDACVARAGAVVPYGHFAWLRAVANGRFGALVWEENGVYEAIFPLVEERKWGVIPYMAMPPFTQRLGLYAPPDADLRPLASSVSRYLRRAFLRADIALEGSKLALSLSDRCVPMENRILGLDRPLQVLEAGFGKSIRQKLKLAETAGLWVEATPSGLSAFRFIREHLAPRLHYWNARYDYAWGRLCVVPDAPFRLVGRVAYADALPIAAAVLVEYGSRTIYLAGASSEVGLEQGAMAFLLWQEIKNRAGQPGAVLDFEGGNMGGTRQFFSMFGAEAETYWQIRLGL